jgi:hypothetical protein
MISLIGMFRDEGKYIEEWILYHYIMGIKDFAICCHQCTDNTPDILNKLNQQHKDLNIVTVINNETNKSGWEFKNNIYTELCSLAKNDWCLCLDIDEFLTMDWNYVANIIEEKNIGGIAIYQNIFGSSGHILCPKGLVIDNYLYRNSDAIVLGFEYPLFNQASDLFKSVKILFNKQNLKRMVNAHEVILSTSIVNEKLELFKKYKAERSTKHIKINHYFTKSLDDWQFKVSRPRMSGAIKYPDSWFDYFSNMPYKDELLSQKYSSQIKYYQSMV